MATTDVVDHDEVKAAFGRRLRALRRERGLSQMRLAAAANLDATYITSIEAGRRNVSLVNIHKLALGLGVPPGLLLDPPDAASAPPR